MLSSTRDDFVEKRIRLGEVGGREAEHLDLRELVHAVNAARRPAVGSRLRAETVRQAGVLERQDRRVEDLVFLRAPQSDFGRRHEAQVAVFD